MYLICIDVHLLPARSSHSWSYYFSRLYSHSSHSSFTVFAPPGQPREIEHQKTSYTVFHGACGQEMVGKSTSRDTPHPKIPQKTHHPHQTSTLSVVSLKHRLRVRTNPLGLISRRSVQYASKCSRRVTGSESCRVIISSISTRWMNGSSQRRKWYVLRSYTKMTSRS